MVALIREPPRDDGPARRISLRSSHDEVDVSAIARSVGRRRAPAGGRLLVRGVDRRDRRLPAPPVRAGDACRRERLRPVGVALVDKPAGPVVVRARRRAAPPHARAHRARRHARSVRDGAAAPALGRGDEARAVLRRARQALRHRDRPDRDDDDRRSGGRDRRGARPPRASELDDALAALRGEVELPIPAASAVKIDGERAYKLARRGVAVEMPLRRSTVHALELVERADDGATPAARAARQLGHVRARDRPGARRALHVAAADRDRAVRDRPRRAGRRRSSCSRSPAVLDRLPPDALARVPEQHPRRRARARHDGRTR